MRKLEKSTLEKTCTSVISCTAIFGGGSGETIIQAKEIKSSETRELGRLQLKMY